MSSTTITVNGLSFKEYISETKIQERVAELGLTIREKYRDKNPIFLGILNGVFIFAADLVRASHIPCEITFTRLSSYEGLSSSGEIRTVFEVQEDLAGRHVILVEDIIDTGRTLHHFIPELKALQPASVAIVSLLRKPDALEFDLPIDLVGFDIPNAFVIGYGLDYDGYGRELRSIYQKAD